MKFIKFFDTSKKNSTGGVTGSAQVKSVEEGKYYQLKPSILDNPSRLRRIKAGNTDRENFGEVIASCIGRELLNKDEVPEVSLVYDPTRKKVSVASKYLEGDPKNKGEPRSVRTLDEYAVEKGVKIPPKKRHARFVAGTTDNEKMGEMGLDAPNMSHLKKGLARAIVVSAVTGDHDVNPGNMLVVTKDGKDYVARIDFGHALNDLINTAKANGGQLLDPNNPIMDFFNRPKVAGIGGDTSKLWRDYPGLVPSQEMVDSLKEMESDFKTKAELGVLNAKEEFKTLIDAMQENKDQKGIDHVKKSLATIYANISGKKLNLNLLTAEQTLDKAFEGINAFTQKQGQNLEKAANVMQVQLDIDAALKSGKPIDPRSIDLLNKNNFPTNKGKIQWVKAGATTPAFSGSVDDYMLNKVNQLIKENPSKKTEIIKNYRELREQCFKAEQAHNLTQETPKVGNSTTAFKQRMQEITVQAKGKEIDTEKLVERLNDFIDAQVKEGNKLFNFSFHSKSDRVNAASALIQALNGKPNVNLATHADVLNSSPLKNIINNVVGENIDLKMLPKKDGVNFLLRAIKNNTLSTPEPVQRVSSTMSM